MAIKQDKIIKGRNNAVVILFSGVDLTMFTKVQAIFGADTRDSVADATSVVVVSATELNLFFGDTAETASPQFWRITGFDGGNPLGVDLTSQCIGNLNSTGICT